MLDLYSPPSKQAVLKMAWVIILLISTHTIKAQSADYISVDTLITFNSLISDNFANAQGTYVTLDLDMMSRNYAIQKHTTTPDISYFVEDILYKGLAGTTTIEYNGGRTNVAGGALGFDLQTIVQSSDFGSYKLWVTTLEGESRFIRQTMTSLMSRTYTNTTGKALTTIALSTTGTNFKMVIERLITY